MSTGDTRRGVRAGSGRGALPGVADADPGCRRAASGCRCAASCATLSGGLRTRSRAAPSASSSRSTSWTWRRYGRVGDGAGGAGAPGAAVPGGWSYAGLGSAPDPRQTPGGCEFPPGRSHAWCLGSPRDKAGSWWLFWGGTGPVLQTRSEPGRWETQREGNHGGRAHGLPCAGFGELCSEMWEFCVERACWGSARRCWEPQILLNDGERPRDCSRIVVGSR